MAIACKSCGGTVTREGNFYVCEYCRNKWEVDSANDVHAVDRANAWSALRDGDFEKSAELFEEIIVKESKNHEAYWGRALALAGIVYVTDMNESKKVPTCNNITEDSFINDKDVQKAISLAPGEISAEYKKQAEYIEKVRVEWLEKASKEPAYDVFISFKDSDRENGIERTQDSVDAQDLYNALVAEGYKVFFSRISLRDKIAEQYEPYIYNAIKTAKVMIVFGEKAEYFSSVWIKNEWSRFKTRIEKGEKHKNSLVVVYKNINPGDLPVVLRSRQCLNAAEMTFLPDLTRHIKRVVEESKRSVHLEKIEITGGQMSKKATSLSVNSVERREIGAGAIAETSISEKQTISLIHTYMGENQWDSANRLIDDVLFNNPTCAEALWCRILVRYCVNSNAMFVDNLARLQPTDLPEIEKVLNCASKDFAQEILELLYTCEQKSSKYIVDFLYNDVLKTILPFSYENRQKRIDEAFESVIKQSKMLSFQTLLNTLEPSQVDKFIDYNFRYAAKTPSPQERVHCLNSIIAVDEGNVDALRFLVDVDLSKPTPEKETTEHFESLLKYAKDVKGEVVAKLNWLSKSLVAKEHCSFARQLLKYYPEEMSTLKNELISLAYRMINQGYFEDAEYILNLILTFETNNSAIYWAICLMKVKATSEENIKNSDIPLKSVPEFNKYLTLVNEQRRKACINITTQQEAQLRAKEIKREKQEKLHEILHKAKKVLIIAAIAFVALFILIMILGGYVIPKGYYDDGIEYLAQGKYEEAIEKFEEANGFKDSETKIDEVHYQHGLAYLEQGEYSHAISEFEKSNSFSDADEKIEEAKSLREQARTEETYKEALESLQEGDITSALSYFSDITEYKDSANYVIYLTAVDNALDEEYDDIFEMEDDLQGLPSDFEPAKELLGFIERNKQYKDKNYYYRPGGEYSYKSIYNEKGEKFKYEHYIEVRAQLEQSDEGELVVVLYWSNSKTTLALSDSITGSHKSETSGFTCVINGSTVKLQSEKSDEPLVYILGFYRKPT